MRAAAATTECLMCRQWIMQIEQLPNGRVICMLFMLKALFMLTALFMLIVR